MASTPSVEQSAVFTGEQVRLIQNHLKEILASRAFAGSKRNQEFLSLLVSHTLEGDFDSLRERMIGAELFGRPVSYDTGNDSVVRVRASEVRKKLAAYYAESGSRAIPVRIELPSGSYLPRFHFHEDESVAQTPLFASQPDLYEAKILDPSTSFPARSLPGSNPGSSTPALSASRAGSPISPSFRARTASLFRRSWIPAMVLLVAAFIPLARRLWLPRQGTERSIRSIAILPLENNSADASQEYFADGITEELINDLGQVPGLRVISLTSSMSYKGTHKTLPTIAHELSVDGVLEGGILREGNQVHISVQLIDATADRLIWAHTYTRTLNDVPSWQGEVAQAVAEQISIQLTPQQHALLSHESAVNSQAQDLYLHGILMRDADKCEQAIGFFNQAIALSPAYAQPHSALASCYGRLGESGRMPYLSAFTLQKEEALKALALDSSLPEAHSELANSEMTLDHDWSAADAEFRRALQLNPNSATTHEKYAFYLVRTGHTQDALSEIATAVALDPVAGSTFHAEGFVDYFSRQYDRALTVAQTVRGLKINLPDWYFLLGDAEAGKGDYIQSIAAYQKSGSDIYSLGHLGSIEARTGHLRQAYSILTRLESQVDHSGIGCYEIALIEASLGDKNTAFRWLDRAFENRDVGLVYLKVDPSLDPLRTDPRFSALLQRVGLTN